MIEYFSMVTLLSPRPPPPNKAAACVEGGHRRCAGASADVRHHLAGPGIGLDEILAQLYRLLRGVDGALDGWKGQHISGIAQAVLRAAAGTGKFPVVGAVPTVARNFLVGLALLKLRIVKRKFLIEHQNILRLF